MSPETGQPDGDGVKTGTVLGNLRPTFTGGAPRPTFTASASGPATVVASDPAPTVPRPSPEPQVPPRSTAPPEVEAEAAPEVDAETAPDPQAESDVESESGVPLPSDSLPESPAELEPDLQSRPAPVPQPNEPLLSDAEGLRRSWQQVQAGFVDDPKAAVVEAADLVEHTAQVLVGALRQRQRQLRAQWDGGRPQTAGDTARGDTAASDTAGPGSAGPAVADTEQLRLMMQRYRGLFNQLVRP